MRNEYIDEMRSTTEKYDIKKLQTPKEVDNVFLNQKGTMLVFVNSACGCAGRVARPALDIALEHPRRPDAIATIFASSDREAAAQVRKYFTNQQPSSPSFALMRDGEFLSLISSSDIETSTPSEVAQLLTEMFDKYCTAKSTGPNTRIL